MEAFFQKNINVLNSEYLIKKRKSTMGYLKTAGAPLKFADLVKVMRYIKKHGVIQFCNLYQKFKDRTVSPGEPLKWGDELEYHLVHFDHGSKKARLLLNAKELQEAFNGLVESKDAKIKERNVLFQPEYGAWMIEVIPKMPCGSISLKEIASVEANFKARSGAVNSFLESYGSIGISRMVAFPIMGVGDYATRFSKEELKEKFSDKQVATEEEKKHAQENDHELLPLSTEGNRFSQSIFTFDAAINPHPRFPTLSQNIRERRGSKVCIKIPMYMDKFTQATATTSNPYPGFIYMDSMQFGMGCCCLQLTFECRSVAHARHLHDQLLALAPIMSALSASSPVYRGYLSDIDLRFTVICQSVDDRTISERDPTNPEYVHKSRYSFNSHYISNDGSVMPHHNDSPKLRIDPELNEMLIQNGLDERLAYHIASLFTRDPLVVYEKAIELDDTTATAHFENLQSTNWNAIRFKPPPAVDSDIGWRVEFRPMDLQLTDYENAALSAIVALLVKLINETEVNFIIPISLCDKNMDRAHKRDAILTEKFYFRTNVTKGESKEVVEEMTIAEILAGKKDSNYAGLLPLINSIIEKEPGKSEDAILINEYMEFLLGRATGKYRTGAKYIRDFVLSHPEYKHDSVISERIAYDLICHTNEIANEKVPSTVYLGDKMKL